MRKREQKKRRPWSWARVVCLKELALLAVKLTIVATLVAAQAKTSCQSNCRDISIPYPFGTCSIDCNISRNFFICCEYNTLNPPKAYLTTSDIEVLNISLDGYLHIREPVGYACYNSLGRDTDLDFDMWIRFSRFTISHTRNKFTTIGYDTYAYIEREVGQKYSTGCLTFCNDITNVINGSCSGIGCCEIAIPKGVRSYNVTFFSYNSHSQLLGFNPCSYGFVVENEAYTFSISNLYGQDFRNKEFPIATIGYDTYAYTELEVGQKYSNGCLTFCNDITDVMNGSCSIIGCCEIAIPKGVRSYNVTFSNNNSHSHLLGFNPCSYGFCCGE